MNEMKQIEVDKIGSATSPLNLPRTLSIVDANGAARAGDVVVVRVLTDNATYNMLELPTGRLAKVNPGDVLAGVLGRRRALKGFVGDVPETVSAGDELHLLNLGGVIGSCTGHHSSLITVSAGDELHLLNLGGVIGSCTGHHSSLNDAIKVKVIGLAANGGGSIRNIADVALPLRKTLGPTAPLIVVAGACMNSGKTYVATEIIQQGTRNGFRVAAAKLSGIACLRDTLNMADHGAMATASFLDCGLPSTVGAENLAPVAKAIIARLNESAPDLIVIELGDGILGGYSVESVFEDDELREAMTALVFCASDYVGAWGGIELFKRRDIAVDLIAGSVTDSQMGEDYIQNEFGVPAANARRNGAKLFEMVRDRVRSVPGAIATG